MIKMGRFTRRDDDEEESKLSDLLSIYTAIKEEEEKRDEQIKVTDFTKILKYIELCIELADKKSKYARQKIRLPSISSVLLLMTKTQYSTNDNLRVAMENLINEYYDEPIYTPLLKFYFIDFLVELLKRVDLDSKERAEVLKSIHKAGKIASGIFPEIASDLKTYAKSKFAQNIYNQQDTSNIDDADKDIEDIEEDIYNEMVG